MRNMLSPWEQLHVFLVVLVKLNTYSTTEVHRVEVELFLVEVVYLPATSKTAAYRSSETSTHNTDSYDTDGETHYMVSFS